MLDSSEITSVRYHDIFDYPLSFSDLIRWRFGKLSSDINYINSQISVVKIRGFYFLKGREGLIYKKIIRKRISSKKMAIAVKVAKVLSMVADVKMVGITGSLAMGNSEDKSDIDLFIITKQGKLWTTRAICYILIWLNRFGVMRFKNKYQKDKLCLNMWIDESDLIWDTKDRNLYTAHEIAQIIPLVNKDNTFDDFLSKNKWVLSYWPSAVKILSAKNNHYYEDKVQGNNILGSACYALCTKLEYICYRMQYLYMKSKITREIVTPTRAIFHPSDIGKIILDKLSS